jgi:lipopolysaccharide cholinephosphotransferase
MKLTISEIQEIETEMLKEVSEICEINNIDYFLAYGSALGAVRHNGPIPWDSDIDIVVPYNQLKKFIAIMRKKLPKKFYLDYYDINQYFTPTFPRIGLKGYSTETLHFDVFTIIGLPSDKDKRKRFYKKIYKLSRLNKYKTISNNYIGYRSYKEKIKMLLFKTLLLPISLTSIRKHFEEMCSRYPYHEATYVTNPSGNYGLIEIMPKAFLGKGILMNYSDLEVNIPEKYDDYLGRLYNNYLEYPPENKRYNKHEFKIRHD